MENQSSKKPNNIVNAIKWLGKKQHQLRHIVNDAVKLSAPRRELAEALGWQRALKWGSPDWYRAYPSQQSSNLENQLETACNESSNTVRTAATSLSYLLHTANDPCSHATAEEAVKHEQKKEEARKLIKPITEALTAHTAFAYQDKTILGGGTFFSKGDIGSIKIPGQLDPDDEKALALLKYLATEYPQTKGAISRWHMETARAVTKPKEKGLFNNPALNIGLTTAIMVSGGAALGQMTAQAVQPLKRNETPISRVADVASTSAIVIGAGLYGKSYSLSDKSNRPSSKTRAQSDTYMGLHGVSELTTTTGNTAHAISTTGAASILIGGKEVTDSALDLIFTPAMVGLINTTQDVGWDAVALRAPDIAKKYREKHRHNINGVGAMIGGAALTGVNLALATPLMIGYGTAYGAVLARNVPKLAKQGAAKIADYVQPRKKKLLQTAVSFGAGIAVTTAGFLGFNSGQSPKVSAPPTAPQPTMTQQTLSGQQAATLLEAYTSPTGENLQALQGMGGSAANESHYQPHAPEAYIQQAENLTNLPSNTLAQAMQNVATHTQNTYTAMATQAGMEAAAMHQHFNTQYQDNDESTSKMIGQTIIDWETKSNDNKKSAAEQLLPHSHLLASLYSGQRD